jgi:hypothetical protein
MTLIQDLTVTDFDQDSREAVAVAMQRVTDAVPTTGISLRFYAAGIAILISPGAHLPTLLADWVRAYTRLHGGEPL